MQYWSVPSSCEADILIYDDFLYGSRKRPVHVMKLFQGGSLYFVNFDENNLLGYQRRVFDIYILLERSLDLDSPALVFILLERSRDFDSPAPRIIFISSPW